MDPLIVAVMIGIMVAGACLIVWLAPDPLQQPQLPAAAVEDPEDEWPWP